jgi:hypothetical protein
MNKVVKPESTDDVMLRGEADTTAVIPFPSQPLPDRPAPHFHRRLDPGFQISAEIPDIQGRLFEAFCSGIGRNFGIYSLRVLRDFQNGS